MPYSPVLFPFVSPIIFVFVPSDIWANDSTNQTPAQTFEVFTFLLGNWLCMRDFDYFEKLQ